MCLSDWGMFKKIVDYVIITCAEIKREPETVPIKFKLKKQTYIIGPNKNTYYHITDNINIEVNNELKENDISNCPCYYFDDIINISDLDLVNISLNEK